MSCKKFQKVIWVLSFATALLLMIPSSLFAGECGDVNDDSTINIFDITYLISYLYVDGPDPDCGVTSVGICGDVNYDATVNIFDITYLISYLYLDGPDPQCYVCSIPSTTHIIPVDSGEIILDYDTSGTLILDSSSPFAQSITVGEIIVGQDDSTAPNGLLRKVTSVTTQGDSMIFETDQATLREAVDTLEFQALYKLSPSDVVSYELFNGTTFTPDKERELFNVDYDCVIYDNDGDSGTTNDQIKLYGNYTFDANFYVEAIIDWLTVGKFEAAIITSEEATLGIDAKFEYSFGVEEFKLAQFVLTPITIIVGGFPVVITPTLTVNAHIAGDLTITFTTSVEYTQELKYGFGYANEQYYEISEHTQEFTYNPPELQVEFDFNPGISLNIECLLYGVAGPYASGKAELHFQAALDADPCVFELTFNLDANLLASVGIVCDVLDLNYNQEYPIYTYHIWDDVFNVNFGPDSACVDIDGNVYETVWINCQLWMAENLKVTRYRNGDSIPQGISWCGLTTGTCGVYDNDSTNAEIYGRLYNWYAAVDPRNIAPEGWHVPDTTELWGLIDYLGGEDIAGGKMKDTGLTFWSSPNAGATNESGFTAIGSGLKWECSGYSQLKARAYYWTSTSGATNGKSVRITYDNATAQKNNNNKGIGFSIRCVKD